MKIAITKETLSKKIEEKNKPKKLSYGAKRQKGIAELYINMNGAEKIFIELKGWLSNWSKVQAEKENYTRQALNKKYQKYGKAYLTFRNKILKKILLDKKLYKEVNKLASESFLFDILIDGYSYDVNRVKGSDRSIGFLPFDEQLKLIDAIQNSDKNIHVEKSRRQGASAIMGLAMAWMLKHGKSLVLFATHKDLKSIDGGKSDDAYNSTFQRIIWLLNKSIFIDVDWKDRKKWFTEEHQTKRTGYFVAEKKIVVRGNSLTGEVLGKGTAVGFAGDYIFVDELDPVCEMYPNQADKIFGSFSSSVDRMFIYSTYRSTQYPFYKTRLEDDTSQWDFIKLDWKDNPVCNLDWYNYQCAKLANDEVMIARELDINPTKARKGRVWANIDEYNYIETDRFNLQDESVWTRVIAGDNGGTSQVYITAYFNRRNGKIVLKDMFRVGQFSAKDVMRWAKKQGFGNAIIYTDRATKAQVSFKGYGIHDLLKAEGFKLKGVDNRSIYKTHALMRLDFDDKNILVLKGQRVLKMVVESYAYDEKIDAVKKDEFSHPGDAISYLWRGLFNKNSAIAI